MKWKILIPIVVFLVVVSAAFWILKLESEQVGWSEAESGQSASSESPNRSSSNDEQEEIPVFFPMRDLQGVALFKMDTSILPSDLKKRVNHLFGLLSRAPSRNALPVFDKAILPAHILQSKDGILFLDFSRSTFDHEAIGVEMEILKIDSILRTLGRNVPGIRAVRFLINGKETESLWGHVYTRQAFAVPST